MSSLASVKHIRHQGPVLATIGRTALTALRQRRSGAPTGAEPFPLPGPLVEATLPPRDPELVRDYLREVGGDPASWRGALPPHFFAQWGVPFVARAIEGVPYPIVKVLNAGCRLEVNGRIPADQPLHVTAQLTGIDDDGRKAILHTRVTTGTAARPDLLVAHFDAIVPLGKGKGAGEDAGEGKTGRGGGGASPRARRDLARVPEHARELAYWRLGPENALSFAMLTGDLNPLHWVRPYARALGFKGVILHGFATLARTYEGLVRRLYAGQVDRIATLEVRFTRPLVLPARVGLYLVEDQVFVGDAPGGPAYLVGRHTSAPAPAQDKGPTA
jgi:acyl dehydratase